MFNIKRMLNTELGKFLISVVLGIGLATLFRRACTDKNCIGFNGPVIDEVTGKTYKFGEVCYEYKLVSDKCNNRKKIVELNDAESRELSKNIVVDNEVADKSPSKWFGIF